GIHGLHAGRRPGPPDAYPWRAGLARPRVRRPLRQDVRRLRGPRADRRARRHRLAETRQARACRGRRLLRPVPRPHRLGLLLEQARRSGSALHRQHLRLRVERVPPRGARKARRQLRVTGNGKRETGDEDRETGNGKRETRKVKNGNRLGVGFIGSGFNARFHLQAFQAVRDADVLGVWSPSKKRAEEAAALARRLDVGQAKSYRSIAELVADPAIDALWLCGPNFARIENVEEIADTVAGGKGELKGVACEKPLARNVAEAKRVTEPVKKAGVAPGCPENQPFAPAVIQGRAIIWARGAALTGRPYLARA